MSYTLFQSVGLYAILARLHYHITELIIFFKNVFNYVVLKKHVSLSYFSVAPFY